MGNSSQEQENSSHLYQYSYSCWQAFTQTMMEFTLFSMRYHFLVSHWSLSFHRCTKSDFLVSTSTEHLKQWILHDKSSLKWRSSKTLIHKWTKRQPVVSKTSIPSSLVTLGSTHQHSFEISVPVLIFITDSCLLLSYFSIGALSFQFVPHGMK